MDLTPEEQAEYESRRLEKEEIRKQINEISQRIEAKKNPVSQPEQADTSTPEAFVRGAAQGATFGTADEITAGIESVFTPKTYDQSLKESRAEYDLAEKEHPVASALGGVAGGVAQAAALSMAGGAPGAAAVPGVVGKLQKVAQLGKAAFLPSKGASATANIARMAGSGALTGGLTSIGDSEKEGLSRLEDAGSGIVSGGAIGGLLGGAGAGIGKAGQAISKKIDAGEAPKVLRMVRDAFTRSRKGDLNLFTEKGLNSIETELLGASENVIRPTMKTALDELSTVKAHILDNVPKTIDVEDIMAGLHTKLKNVSYPNAKHALDTIHKQYKASLTAAAPAAIAKGAKAVKEIRPTNLQEMIRYVDDLANVEKNGPISKELFTFAKELKNRLRSSISEEDAYNVIKNSPEMLAKYTAYVKEVDPTKFASAAKNAGTTNVALPKKGKGKVSISPEEIAKKAEAIKIKIAESPLTALDTGITNIKSAADLMGEAVSGKTETEAKRAIANLFLTLRSQGRDTASGKAQAFLYDEAMKNVRKVAPAVADKVDEAVNAGLNKLEIKKFIEGGTQSEGAVSQGALKGIMSNMGQYAVSGASLVGQTLGSAAKGKSGIIPGATTILRPGVTMMSSIATQAEKELAKNPNSITWKFISENMNKAINEADPARRAAILNTLMQYETFRKAINLQDEKK